MQQSSEEEPILKPEPVRDSGSLEGVSKSTSKAEEPFTSTFKEIANVQESEAPSVAPLEEKELKSVSHSMKNSPKKSPSKGRSIEKKPLNSVTELPPPMISMGLCQRSPQYGPTLQP